MKSKALLVMLMGCLLTVAVGARSEPPQIPAKGLSSLAESLRAYFAAEDRIVDVKGSAVSILIDKYFSVQTPQACHISRVEDNPAHVLPGTVGIFLVDMADTEQLCAGSPLRGPCRLLRRSCVAVENSIFCDVAFNATMTLLSEAAYADLFLWVFGLEKDHVETEEERSEREILPMQADALPFPPLLRNETFIGIVNSAKYAETTRGRSDRFVQAVEDISRCHGSALAQLPLMLGVYGPVIAHEYGHVEQFACPAGAIPSPSDATEAIDMYRKIACSTAATSELLADFRSVELLEEATTRMMFDLARLGISPLEHCTASQDPVPISGALEDRIDWRLRSDYYALYVTGLFVGSEYRTIVGKDYERGITILSKEPLEDSDKNYPKDIKAYYRDVAYQQQHLSIPGTTSLLGHMSEPFRVSLMLTKDPQVLLARLFPVEKLVPDSGLFFYPGLRTEGLLRGHIEGLHEVTCPNAGGGREECERLASEVVERTFPLPKQ